MLNDRSTPARLAATRRSAKARDLVEPGPTPDQLDRILAAGMRVPDHGKLAPWRFVVIGAERRDAFAGLLKRVYCAEKPDARQSEVSSLDQFAHQAPCLVAVLSTPRASSHIPHWEQELSSGAACMAMLYAAHAEGLAGCWLTGWAAYSPIVAEALGHPGARIAGFLFFGTPGRALDERPRPTPESVISHW